MTDEELAERIACGFPETLRLDVRALDGTNRTFILEIRTLVLWRALIAQGLTLRRIGDEKEELTP
jgi:hypothetical protein